MYYNWNIIGHEKELLELENDFLHGNIHHAYLFVGADKIGKFRIAKAVAQILQCENNFCHTCQNCIQIEKQCHADTLELEDDGESIGIDAVKEIIARLSMTAQNKHKILMIQNIGRLTEQAANCLLKTLEEPTEHTVFIFTAGQLRDIMPTIASRMRIINFRKLPDDVLRSALKEKYANVDDETLEQAISLSLGRSGKAIQLLSNPEYFHEIRELYKQIQFLHRKAPVSTRIIYTQDLIGDPIKLKTFLPLLVHYLRLQLFAEKSTEAKNKLVTTIQEIHTTMDLLDRNINQRLLLENLMIKL